MGKVAQAVIDARFSEFIGAKHYERSRDRKDRRNGFRDRSIDTRMGSIDLKIPRAREGNFVPPLVEHRKRSERALVAAVQEMFVSGVSTRKIEKVLHELGVAQMSKSQVSVLCAELDVQIAYTSAGRDPYRHSFTAYGNYKVAQVDVCTLGCGLRVYGRASLRPGGGDHRRPFRQTPGKDDAPR
jgi:hypothetical protein